VSARVTVLVVDDEPLARRRLRSLLDALPWVRCVEECPDGQAAVEWLLAHPVDIVLLDVQMPGLSGFDVIDMVGSASMPPVVFVTAFDRYAVRAFDVNAVDYVLKPFSKERLSLALERAGQRLSAGSREALAERLDRVLQLMAANRPRPDRLLVRHDRALHFLRVDEIEWIESQGNYVRFHAGAQAHTVRDTLTRVEARLDPDVFVRIRRTAIVNVARIARLDPWEKDEHVVVMAGGARIAVGRGYGTRLADVVARQRL
jgi:two-component system LytT family response regulator